MCFDSKGARRCRIFCQLDDLVDKKRALFIYYSHKYTGCTHKYRSFASSGPAQSGTGVRVMERERERERERAQDSEKKEKEKV